MVYSASPIVAPASTNPAAYLSRAAAEALAAGSVTLGSTMRPMKGVWPAVDATNGPLTADSGLVSGSPSATGKVLYTPGSTPQPFNLQSQYMLSNVNGVAGNGSGSTCWLNYSSPRTYTFGTRSGVAMESNIDFSFITDSPNVTVVYYHYTGYSGSNYHDAQWYVDHDGEMRKVTRMPATGSFAGNGYRTLSFKEGRSREHRILLPYNCWLVGVYIDANYSIRPAANRFFAILNGDSWTEPQGGTIQSPAGGAFASGGTYRNMYLPQAIIEETGWAIGLCSMGGTGEFNDGTGTARATTYTSGGGVSVFHGRSRIDDMATKFFARSPLVWCIGGWNDGTLGGSPYGTNYANRVLEGIDYYRGKKADVKLLYSSIQPVAESGTALTASRIECIVGQAFAYSQRLDNVIGFIDQQAMWDNKGTAGPRAINCGADTIHLNAKGANQVAGWNVEQARRLVIPGDYVEAMLTAA